MEKEEIAIEDCKIIQVSSDCQAARTVVFKEAGPFRFVSWLGSRNRNERW